MIFIFSNSVDCIFWKKKKKNYWYKIYRSVIFKCVVDFVICWGKFLEVENEKEVGNYSVKWVLRLWMFWGYLLSLIVGFCI